MHARQGLFTPVATQSECKLEKERGGVWDSCTHIQVPSDKGMRGGGAGKGLTVLLSKSSRERGEVSWEMEQGEEMKD